MSITSLIRSGLCAAALAFAFAVPAAQAATVNLGGATGTASSYTYTAPGFSFDVTGERRAVVCGFLCLTWGAEDVSRAANGLGVKGGLLDSAELDGQIDERLTFTFSQAVRLISVAFSFIDNNDEYDLYIDTGDGNGLTLLANNGNANPFTFGPNTNGRSFQIAVDGNASAFRVSQVVAAVPVPAAGLLLVGALGLLGAVRRRKAV